MKSSKLSVFFLTAVFLLGLSPMAIATPITVANWDFEDLSQSNNSWTAGEIPGWGDNGNVSRFQGTYDPPDGNENNVAYNNSEIIGQWLNVDIQEGYTYEFDVLAASRYSSYDIFGVSFVAGENSSAQVGTNTVIRASEAGITGYSDPSVLTQITFSTTFGSQYWGKELGLWLKKEGGRQVWFDDVKVNEYASSPVPEPATMLLLGAGLVGLAGMGRKNLKMKK